jgi:alpha-tubulin suppressor-like RCC1 family protein
VWGNNESGQLGLGSDEVPTMVRRPILNNFVQNVQRVSASHEHSMALTKMGELFTWGSSMLTGLGEKEDRHTPLVMDYFKPHKITQVCCGGLHTMVLTNKGHLYSWGSAEGGQLGIPELTCESIATPQKLETIANIKIV